jgi:MYXO-CTERM domain-containing protein
MVASMTGVWRGYRLLGVFPLIYVWDPAVQGERGVWAFTMLGGIVRLRRRRKSRQSRAFDSAK